jgi:predicted phage-related endonuclease
MTQMNRAMAALKLSLAEMRARDDRLKAMIRQFETQLKRIPRQAMYGRAPLNLALGSMAEIEERLRHSQTERRHLLNIMEQARLELEALVLVQRIELAREQLVQLQNQPGEEADEDTQTEIIRLEGYIAQYSKQAERAITTGSNQRVV